MVTHGGAGTTIGALAHGLPLLVLPQGADQYANVDAVVAAGAGRRLGRDETTVRRHPRLLRSLVDNAGYRQAAGRVQAEIQAMPTAEHTITRIGTLLAQSSDH